VGTTYTLFGAPETTTDVTGNRTFTYDANLRLSSEVLPSAFYNGRILTRQVDSLGRNAGFTLGVTGNLTSDHAVVYSYDNAGRLAGVTSGGESWAYGFEPNGGNLVSSVTSGNRTVNYAYEPGRDLITGLENKVGNNTVSSYSYTNNRLGQRTARGQTGSAFATAATESFGYNARGELISSSHSATPARNTAFDYDAIGNRNTATFGGGNTTYTANALNQYTTINPGSAIAPTHDLDGNMLSDGAGKNLVWDGENRLIEVRNASNALVAAYTYDGQSRRVKKVTPALAPQSASEEIYLYDGWNRIATYSLLPSSFTLETSLTWGRDLSGTLQGAGGVGGLLGTSDIPSSNSYAFTFDANGNVSELINGAGGIAAHYEYDPFGNAIVATGSYANANPWKFSTKPVDAETGYSYYGFRFYNPETGRWINRDPIGEQGGLNLYGFVANDPMSNVDYFGLTDVDDKVIAHALDTINPGSSGGLPFMNFFRTGPPLTVESSRVDFRSTGIRSRIVEIAKTNKSIICSCKSFSVDQQESGVSTSHLLSLGRINIIVEGEFLPSANGGYEFVGTLEPLTEQFDFNWDTSRGAAAQVATSAGSVAQTLLGVLSFDINFTGPVKYKQKGSVRCR